MKISLITPQDLDSAAQVRWRELQGSNAALASPYFCPEFTRAVGAVRKDVRIAVLEEGPSVVGFFPFQGRWGVGVPVGGGLSDHHGMIAAPGTRWDWNQLLSKTKLACWQFDHLPLAQARGIDVKAAESPGLDLSRGFEAYKQGRLDAGKRRIAELDRKARKLAREVGPLRLEAHTKDRAVLARVLQLKSLQFRRSGLPDCFKKPWVRDLVDHVLAIDSPHFAGRLSALYAGDQLVAAHLGMRSQRVWHWWFPVYEAAYAKHSPGAHLLMQVAEQAAAQGHVLLDLGKGDDVYKQSFADCSLPLAEGWIKRPALATRWVEARRGAGRWLRSGAQPVLPLVRRWRQRAMLGQPEVDGGSVAA